MAAVYTNKSPVANVRCRRRRDVCRITLDTHPDVHRNLRTEIVITFSSAHSVVCFLCSHLQCRASDVRTSLKSVGDVSVDELARKADKMVVSSLYLSCSGVLMMPTALVRGVP